MANRSSKKKRLPDPNGREKGDEERKGTGTFIYL
jgi:hypothetical protein